MCDVQFVIRQLCLSSSQSVHQNKCSYLYTRSFFCFFFWSVKIESLYLIIVGEIWDQILSVIEDIIPLAIVVIVVFCILSNQRAREQCRSMLTSIIDKIKGNNSRQRRDPEGRRDSEHSVRLHVDETQHSDNSSGE